jgi:peptide-methionine (S)-S-oxide reductase
MKWRCGWPTLALLMTPMMLASCGGGSMAASSPSSKSAAKTSAASVATGKTPRSLALPDTAGRGRAIATFAGGCFWCTESDFEKVPGVTSVISGFTGGQTLNPTYEQVSAGGTGHAESVRITYDPARISYAQLLDYYWHHVDPTQSNGQFCDHGRQYRSAIFYHDSTQHALAEKSRQALAASGVLRTPIVTEIVAAGPFYAAEEYHQDFYKKDPQQYHSYREGCGRDRRLEQLWGREAQASKAALR